MIRSSCSTHKESEKDAHAAARTAGYLLAVSESGLIFDMLEIIGAESLSQRYHFAAQVAHRQPRLRTIVHDDACHLKSMCQKEKQTSVMAARLADMDFIIDDFHSGGHCGEWCKKTCLPNLPHNKDILKGFPTEVAESVNAQFSPLGHCFHHYGPWFAQFVMQECVDVHNMTRVQALADKRRVADKKRKRQPAGDERHVWLSSITQEKDTWCACPAGRKPTAQVYSSSAEGQLVGFSLFLVGKRHIGNETSLLATFSPKCQRFTCWSFIEMQPRCWWPACWPSSSLSVSLLLFAGDKLSDYQATAYPPDETSTTAAVLKKPSLLAAFFRKCLEFTCLLWSFCLCHRCCCFPVSPRPNRLASLLARVCLVCRCCPLLKPQASLSFS